MQKKQGDQNNTSAVRSRSRSVINGAGAADNEIKSGLLIGAGNLDVTRFKDLLRPDINEEKQFKLLSELGAAIDLLGQAYRAAIEAERAIPAEDTAAKINVHKILKELKYKIEYCDVLLAAVVSKEEVQVAKDQSMIVERTVDKNIALGKTLVSEPMMMSYSKANAAYVEARSIVADAAFNAFAQTEKDRLVAKVVAIDDRATKEIQQKGQIAIAELHAAATKQVLDLKGNKEHSDSDKEQRTASPLRLRKKEGSSEKGLLRNISGTQLSSANTASEAFISTVHRVSNAQENSVLRYHTMRHAYSVLDADIKTLPEKYINASAVYTALEVLEVSLENRRIDAANAKEGLLNKSYFSSDDKSAIRREDLPKIKEIADSFKASYGTLKDQLLSNMGADNPLRAAVDNEDAMGIRRLIDKFDGDMALLRNYIDLLDKNKSIVDNIESFVNNINKIDQESAQLDCCRRHVTTFDQFKLVPPSLRDEISQCQQDRQRAKETQKSHSQILQRPFREALNSARDQMTQFKKENEIPKGEINPGLLKLEETFKSKKRDLDILKNYLGEVSEYQIKGEVVKENLIAAEGQVDNCMIKQPEQIKRQWEMYKQSVNEFNTVNQRLTDLKASREELLVNQPCGVLNLTNANNTMETLKAGGTVLERLHSSSLDFQDTKRDIDIINSSKGFFQRSIKLGDYLDYETEQKAAVKKDIDFSTANDTTKKHILHEHATEFKEFVVNKTESEKKASVTSQNDALEDQSKKMPPESDAARNERYENEFVMLKLKQVSSSSSEETGIKSAITANADAFKKGSIVSRAVYVEAQRTQQLLKTQFQDTPILKTSPVLSHTSLEAHSQRSSYDMLTSQMGGAHHQRSNSMEKADTASPAKQDSSNALSVTDEAAKSSQKGSENGPSYSPPSITIQPTPTEPQTVPDNDNNKGDEHETYYHL